MVYLFLCFFLPFAVQAEEPWGKDAALATQFSPSSFGRTPSPPCFITQWGIRAIRFHQTIISPADGPRSHFIPSSSQYTLEAMQKYGFLTGVVMGCDRLMRENNDPWVYRKILDTAGHPMKWDPVK